MKPSSQVIASLLLTAFLLPAMAQEPSAREIVKTADENLNGEKTAISSLSMTIVRPGWERSIEMKNWTSGRDFALTLITAPARDKGQSFLKRQNEMWNWNPRIGRLIKLPPSMMSQGWMGSDYTNDDILKESSVVDDYHHELIGEELLEGRPCYKIRMVAKADADVIWGSQIRWIDKKNFVLLKSELYDEDDYLMRTELSKKIKRIDGRLIPTRIELIPAEEEGHMTILEIKEAKFNSPIKEGFFSQQNMKRLH